MSAQAKRILVAYDGSETAERALDTAAQLVGYGSTLTVVSVASHGAPGMRARLDAARERLLRRQVTATYVERVGEAADEIVEAAREFDADLVVIGRREPPVEGSVSAEVVRQAPGDVLVVR
jgi:nucleotide-binding universal stress UspA family protein